MTLEPVIRSLTIRNLLSFGDIPALVDLQNLNVLIGPNGSGKSNLIEVLGLLHHAAGGHAHRRGQALQEHLDLIPNDLPGMLLTYDYWQEPSRPLRQYLWAYVQEDQQRGRTLIEVLGPQRVKRIMRYLAEDYWVRYLGWPDLVSWREGGQRPGGRCVHRGKVKQRQAQ